MYLLDANIFIQAKNRHYAFDVVPGFLAMVGEGSRHRNCGQR